MFNSHGWQTHFSPGGHGSHTTSLTCLHVSKTLELDTRTEDELATTELELIDLSEEELLVQ
jgi:hypothetical protein